MVDSLKYVIWHLADPKDSSKNDTCRIYRGTVSLEVLKNGNKEQEWRDTKVTNDRKKENEKIENKNFIFVLGRTVRNVEYY